MAAAHEIHLPGELQPIPQELEEEPSPNDPLPEADVAMITWTVAEHRALADVLTPDYPAKSWYRYARHYDAYEPKIRRGAPADRGHRLGTYFLTKIRDKTVLKSYQFVGDPIPPPSNAPNHQHEWEKDHDLPSAGDQRTNNVQMVALDHVPAGIYHITVRADNTPVPDQAQGYAICALVRSAI